MKVMVDPHAVFPEDMTQEELDSIVEAFQKMADEGTLEENSIPVSEEELEELIAAGYISDEELKPN